MDGHTIGVLPAQAGMIPATLAGPFHTTSAPRASGDDPETRYDKDRGYRCSPRKRG